ncbi:phage minor head protein [Tropicimonas sp. S265A]|uniref:phage head morphogenesis protein n=1 Tax=Tropicimonas sp. S265A TaxID=3415134 RepID=UPI003C7BA922
MPERVELAPRSPREAVEYFRSKGYAPSTQRFDWRDVWREEHARMFVVAKAAQDDVLTTIRSELDLALAQGRTLDQFRTDLRPRLQAAGWWGKAIEADPQTGEAREVQLGSNHRLRVIYDTNMRTSYAAGRWARIQRTKAALPFLQYRQVQRPSRRDEHEPYHGIILPVDHPAWAAIYPPNGWFCACSVRQLSRRQMEREGLRVTEDFELDTLPWINPRTGETSELPLGVSPGFDSNPGMAWLDMRAAYDATSVDLAQDFRPMDRALVEEVRARGVRDGVESLAVYDLAADAEDGVLDWNAGNRGNVGFTPAMRAALRRDGAKGVAIHNHPSSTAFSPADFKVMLGSRGLDTLVAVGHDGSLYRASRRTAKVVPAELIDEVQLVARELLAAARAEGLVSGVDAQHLLPHILSLTMDRVGAVRYRFSLSFRMRQAIDQNELLIEQVVEALTRA